MATKLAVRSFRTHQSAPAQRATLATHSVGAIQFHHHPLWNELPNDQGILVYLVHAVQMQTAVSSEKDVNVLANLGISEAHPTANRNVWSTQTVLNNLHAFGTSALTLVSLHLVELVPNVMSLIILLFVPAHLATLVMHSRTAHCNLKVRILNPYLTALKMRAVISNVVIFLQLPLV